LGGKLGNFFSGFSASLFNDIATLFKTADLEEKSGLIWFDWLGLV
jgi:hypothetical protein